MAELAVKKQPDEPDQLRERFKRDLQTAQAFMNPIHQQMDRNYDIYRNRWPDSDGQVKVSDLFAYTETVVPILTNNRVRASVHSDYPEYVQHAQGMTDILDHTYDINNWDYESQKIARMAEIYRSAIAYTGYDPDYKNGSGRLCVKKINMRWCYLDPGTTEFEESSFFFYIEPKRKTEVIKMHPKRKAVILESIGDGKGIEKKGNNWFKSLVNSVKQAVTFNNTNTGMSRLGNQTLPELSEEEKYKNSVAYIHYWYRDEDDKWRVSFWADEIFLEDRENPFWHGCLPYDIYNPTDDILSSLGIPIEEQIEKLNDEKNLLMQYILANAKKVADPPMLRNTALGNLKDPQALREQAFNTGVIDVNNPDMVPLNAMYDFVNFPMLPNYVLDLPDRYSAQEDRITGVNDSFRGMSEATSGKEVQLKQEAAYTRIKTKIDNFELFNKKIAEKMIVNAMQFYKSARAFRIKGDYTKYADIMQQQDQGNAPFSIKPIPTGTNPETQEPVYDRSEFFMYANPNEWTDIVDKGETEDDNQQPQDAEEDQAEADAKPTQDGVKRAYKILQMTVEIEAGSSLPTSRMARREEALELGKMGVIDQEAILDAFDWPKREDIIKRMQEASQKQQEMQMQAQQQQAQAQAAAEKEKMLMQMQVEAAKMDHQANMTQMNNDAKMQQTQAKNQQQPPDIAGGLDQIRQVVPELANVDDHTLTQIMARISA